MCLLTRSIHLFQLKYSLISVLKSITVMASARRAVSFMLSEGVEDDLTCAVCHEVYKVPKLLECTHTFCQQCIMDIVGSSSRFTCPMCRRGIMVPPGGVSAFRDNPHIHPEVLEKIRNATFCREHPEEELKVYCVPCDLPVCAFCIIRGHAQHEMKKLSEAAEQVTEQLAEDEKRIEQAVAEVTKHVADGKKKQSFLVERKEAVEESIRLRHAALTAAADRLRDEALTSLESTSGELESKLSSELAHIQENLDRLLRLQNDVRKASSGGTDHERVTVAKTFRTGAGGPQALQETASQRIDTISRPVLRSGEMDDSAVVEKMRDFVGDVVKLERRESLVPRHIKGRCVLRKKSAERI